MTILYSMDNPTGSDIAPSLSQRTRWIIIAALGVLMLLVAYLLNERQPAPGDADSLTMISSIDQLATAFNADAGRPRVILLFSPT
jgi:hypothetical protein